MKRTFKDKTHYPVHMKYSVL